MKRKKLTLIERKKLTLIERKKQFKTAIEYFRMKEESRRKEESDKLNKLFTSYDV